MKTKMDHKMRLG